MGFADRGVVAEKAVHKFLNGWITRSPYRDFSRLVDTKAAGRVIRKADSDFAYYCLAGREALHGLIEVKETEHEFRLDRSRLTQLPILRKREKCGANSCALVYHSTIRRWSVLSVPFMADGESKGSWDLRPLADFASPADALFSFNPFGFPIEAEK
jgi:hypothetical protein